MINDLCAVAGVVCIVIGAAMLHPAAGWIAAGVLLGAIAVGGAFKKLRTNTEAKAPA